MELSNNEIKLRAIEPQDYELLHSLINDSETEYLLGGWSFPVSLQEQKNWIDKLHSQNNSSCLRLIIEIQDKKSIGTIILSDIDMKNGTAQLHIKMLDCKKRGYGSKSIQLLCDYAFMELRLNLIYASVNSYNITSQKTFEKCFFKKEGILRSRIFKKGEYHDILSYSLLKEEFYAK